MNLEFSIFTHSIQEMQFKYPEILWALFLLLIPIFIHLFQLRRFKKTPFTNVKFLKKVVSESRKSNVVKKWLLLLTRLFLTAAFVLAFAQPFLANKSALQKKETVIYLDNSFSTQLNQEGTTLLENSVQELIRSIPKNERFSLFTNTTVFRNALLTDIQNELLALPNSNRQLKLNEVYLKGKTFFSEDGSTEKNLVIISDFQQSMIGAETDSLVGIRKHLVQIAAGNPQNVALDSAYIITEGSDNMSLTVLLSSSDNNESIPVSLYNNDQLIAKTSADFNEDRTASLIFTLPENEILKAKIEITDAALTYDNLLYFNIDKKEKIKVLAIGPSDSGFLKRIYSEDEFIFSSSSLKSLNYGDLASQNLVILNELPDIPTSLSSNLRAFTEAGGHLVIIPSKEIDFNSYNLLTSFYFSTSYAESVSMAHKISNISFSHPLYRDVFEKNVSNFQYPQVNHYFKVKSNAPTVLSFQDNDPFLIGSGFMYLFTAPLSTENSNFKNSPLVVPTFYRLATMSLKLPRIYSVLGNSLNIDVPVTLAKDQILKVTNGTYEIIPQQRSLANKVSLSFEENLLEDGIYSINEGEKSVGTISFNFPRNESELIYANTNQLQATSRIPSIRSLFEKMEKDNTVTELWKWFVILALLFLLVEIIIQKFFK